MNVETPLVYRAVAGAPPFSSEPSADYACMTSVDRCVLAVELHRDFKSTPRAFAIFECAIDEGAWLEVIGTNDCEDAMLASLDTGLYYCANSATVYEDEQHLVFKLAQRCVQLAAKSWRERGRCVHVVSAEAALLASLSEAE